MKPYLFHFFLQIFHFIPKKIFKNFGTSDNLFSVSHDNGINEWHLTYNNAHDLVQFFFPLINDILTLSRNIFKIFKKTKVVSITVVLVIYDEKNNTVYTTLSESNDLYDVNTFQDWPIDLVYNLVKKLELYNSFKKISLIVKITEITSI